MLYELALSADIQRELRGEVTSSTEDPSFDALSTGYPLLDAVIKETLRLHPPILENHHQVYILLSTTTMSRTKLSSKAEETITIPLSTPIPGTSDHELVIPKGTILEIPVNIIQTDRKEWGSDAQQFRPHRWLERRRNGIKHTREVFAFSEGCVTVAVLRTASR